MTAAENTRNCTKTAAKMHTKETHQETRRLFSLLDLLEIAHVSTVCRTSKEHHRVDKTKMSKRCCPKTIKSRCKIETGRGGVMTGYADKVQKRMVFHFGRKQFYLLRRHATRVIYTLLKCMRLVSLNP